MLKFKTLLYTLLIGILLTSCSPKSRGPNEIYVGTIAGPETDLMQVAAYVAKQNYNLDIKIIEFEDYALPNAALVEGSIDANVFQHQAYLDAAIKAKGYKIINIGKTFIYPMGIYSQNLKSLKELKAYDKVAIPNDPSNFARALLLLENAGLIKLDTQVPGDITHKSITSNPKQLQIIELDAAQLPRVLNDVAIAAINTNYSIPAGYSPQTDALWLESKDSPYANIVVIREADKDIEKYASLVAALNSDEVKQKATIIFGPAAIPAWQN